MTEQWYSGLTPEEVEWIQNLGQGQRPDLGPEEIANGLGRLLAAILSSAIGEEGLEFAQAVGQPPADADDALERLYAALHAVNAGLEDCLCGELDCRAGRFIRPIAAAKRQWEAEAARGPTIEQIETATERGARKAQPERPRSLEWPLAAIRIAEDTLFWLFGVAVTGLVLIALNIRRPQFRCTLKAGPHRWWGCPVCIGSKIGFRLRSSWRLNRYRLWYYGWYRWRVTTPVVVMLLILAGCLAGS